MSKPDTYFLAVDAGTTKIKAAIVAGSGRFIDMESVDAKVIMPFGGSCEMDMNDVWNRTKAVIAKLINRNLEIRDKISAIGVCAQGDGAWMLNEAREPLRNAILWNDTRVNTDFKDINNNYLDGSTPLFSGAAPVIVQWLKKYEPDNYNRLSVVFHCKDWINFRLTGVISTDDTDASTSLVNIYTKELSEPLMKRLGIADKKEAFPKISHSGDIIGGLSETVASELGLKAGIPVISGAIDVLAVATGCSLMDNGQRGSIIGTTLCNYVVLNEAEARKNPCTIGSILCHTKADTYIRLMAPLSGASALDWMRREILGDEDFSSIESKMSEIPVGCEGIIAHPYLYGERSPFALASATGGYYGIRAHHTKYHIARAAYEGIVLSMIDCYKAMPKGDDILFVAGGASKSDFLCQLISDGLGVPVYRFSEKELGILGIYRLLCSALGLKPESTESETDKFLPNLELKPMYDELYKKFADLKERMIPYWERNKI
ncbi:L-xylulose/3-keto-L-gulonate kinase [Clostridiales bacterium]|nr:L-xylulose/3-keto-L-gulonate kinase [Clostridiales bacterium]